VSGQERLGALVYTAWSEARSAHQDCRRDQASAATPIDVLEQIGDRIVTVSVASALWDIAVEVGESSGNWTDALQHLQRGAAEILALPRSTSLVGTAIWQVRQTACQAVLTRADEILAAHAN
jgi:hypothetical protein